MRLLLPAEVSYGGQVGSALKRKLAMAESDLDVILWTFKQDESVKQPNLLDYVRALEGKSNAARREAIVAALESIGIEPHIGECHWLGVKNIVVDFGPEQTFTSRIFSAHYDAVSGSPGANDNASGAAVLLGFCRELKNTSSRVRVIFFDREEAWFRTPLLRLGLLGSLCYVRTEQLRGLDEVYNLEFCGSGDTVVAWPVRESDERRQTVVSVKKAASRLSLKCVTGDMPWYLVSSDHFPFRQRGIDAVTLSMLPGDKISVLKRFLNEKRPIELLFARERLPEPIGDTHTVRDESTRLDEKALRAALALTLELQRNQPGR